MPDTGPHIAVAVLCETVLREESGVVSIIRVVDRLTQTAIGANPPDTLPPFIIERMQMVVSLKSDQAKGRHSLKIVVEDPSGARQPLGEQDLNFQPGNHGTLIAIPVQGFVVQHEGVYWFDLVLGGPRGQEDVLMTRIPLEVVYQRQRLPGTPS